MYLHTNKMDVGNPLRLGWGGVYGQDAAVVLTSCFATVRNTTPNKLYIGCKGRQVKILTFAQVQGGNKSEQGPHKAQGSAYLAIEWNGAKISMDPIP